MKKLIAILVIALSVSPVFSSIWNVKLELVDYVPFSVNANWNKTNNTSNFSIGNALELRICTGYFFFAPHFKFAWSKISSTEQYTNFQIAPLFKAGINVPLGILKIDLFGGIGADVMIDYRASGKTQSSRFAWIAGGDLDFRVSNLISLLLGVDVSGGIRKVELTDQNIINLQMFLGIGFNFL